MATPVIRSIGTIVNESSAQTMEVPAPATIVDGDLLVMFTYASENVTLSTPEAGWTKDIEQQSTAGSDTSIATFYKFASGESGDYTVDISGGNNHWLKGCCFAIRNVSSSSPLDAASTSVGNSANSDTLTPPSITTVTDRALVLSFVGVVQADTPTTSPEPSGYTMRNDDGIMFYIGIASIEKTVPGLEQPGDWSDLGVNADGGAITMAIRPEDTTPENTTIEVPTGPWR